MKDALLKLLELTPRYDPELHLSADTIGRALNRLSLALYDIAEQPCERLQLLRDIQAENGRHFHLDTDLAKRLNELCND